MLLQLAMCFVLSGKITIWFENYLSIHSPTDVIECLRKRSERTSINARIILKVFNSGKKNVFNFYFYR